MYTKLKHPCRLLMNTNNIFFSQLQTFKALDHMHVLMAKLLSLCQPSFFKINILYKELKKKETIKPIL